MQELSPHLALNSKQRSRARLAIFLFYFGQGLGFASWASRIPDIKHHLNLSDAAFGSILLALPVAQLCTMPFSARLVTKYGSKRIITITACLYALALLNLGLANASWQLGAGLFCFGIIGNMANIAVNTQGIEAEKLYTKPIMTTFHAGWSIAGFTGAAIGLLMINLQLDPFPHFGIVVMLMFLNVILNHRYLLHSNTAASDAKRSFFLKPKGTLLQVGIIGFCSMATEGAMFDWSGVYFKDIVQVQHQLVPIGYASFMIMMSLGRFMGDKVIAAIGRRKIIIYSGCIISTGMAIAVLFPYLITATLGFMLVGVGVSSLVPTIYSIAGKNKHVPPGVALAMVSSVSYLGFLMGPPLIGYISAISSLRYSYAVIGCFGLLIVWLIMIGRSIEE
jgi:MFS family permease